MISLKRKLKCDIIIDNNILIIYNKNSEVLYDGNYLEVIKGNNNFTKKIIKNLTILKEFLNNNRNK